MSSGKKNTMKTKSIKMMLQGKHGPTKCSDEYAAKMIFIIKLMSLCRDINYNLVVIASVTTQ